MSSWSKVHSLSCCLLLAAVMPVVLPGQNNQMLRPVVLQLPFTHQFQFAGIYAAQKQGYFLEAGLEVTVRIPSQQHRTAIFEVLSGHAEFGIGQGTQLIAKRLEGQDLVVMAAIMQHSPQVLITRAEANLNNPHDLIGKRVALDDTSLGSEIQLMLAREGIGFDEVKIVRNNWAVNELEEGSADAMSVFVIDAPYTMNRGGKPVRIIRPLDYGVDFYGDCLFTNERTLQSVPEVVMAMRRAVLRGWQYALHHQDEMIDWILAHHSEPSAATYRLAMDREALKYEAGQVALLINAELVELGRINPGRWQRMAEGVKTFQATGDIAKIDGMIYQPSHTWRERLQQLGPWVLGGFAVAAGLIALAGLVNRRLKLLVRRRTAELELSERRQREYFELAPAPIVIEDYTALEPILAELKQSGVSDLRKHLQTNPVLVRDLLKKKHIVAANRLALARAGFATVAEFEQGLAGIMTAETYDSFVEELVAIWQGVDRLTMERSYRRNDGGEIYSILNWEVSRKDGQRDLANVQLVFTEITEQKKAERAMRESEERYRLLFEHSPLAVVEFDYAGLREWFDELRKAGVQDLAAYLREHPEMRQEIQRRSPLKDANESTLRLLGASSKAELQARLNEVFTENTTRVRCELSVGIWNGRISATGEIEVRRLDGQLRTLSYFWRMHADAAGRPAFTRTQTVLVDITEKIATERALRESELRYRELFEQAVGGVYRSDPEGRFQSVNSAMARIFGFAEPSEMIAWSQANDPATLYVQPGRRKEFVAALNERDHLSDFESEIRLRDGGTRWISETVRAVRDPAGRLLHYEGFVTDISTRRQLEAEIARASKLEAVGILAGGIAHDFNNILTVVLGNVTLAEADTQPGSPVASQLLEAKRATLRARDLTLQLLTFAKGGEPVRALIELGEVLKESTAFALHGAKARGEFHLPPQLWRVSADKGQVGQVVHNLVINAVQAMPEGGVITITAGNVELPLANLGTLPLAPGRYVQVSVADTGVGIPPEQQAKIFDPYFTTKVQGSGLGLATTYSIIRKHEGHILVESEPGKGTVFRFWLPAERAAAGAPVASPGGSRSPFRVKVLFMDDEASIRSMAVIFMKRIGYDCDVAADGAEAVSKYQQAMANGEKYAVVVMDLTVPGGMGGLEAMQQLQRIDPDVCAIVSSGYSRDPVLANYQAHGFVAILPKPYGLEQLTKILRTVLDGPGNPT